MPGCQSPEPYLQLKLSWIGLLQFGITVYLLTVSLAHINDPVKYPIVNTHKRTLWAMEHYSVTQTGIKYFNYTDPETKEVFNGTLSGTWFDERLKGKYVFFFGNGFDNFCWPRTTPDSDWFPSLFRSSQLKPWVQVPLRVAVLLGMTFRVFQAIVLAFMRLHQGDRRNRRVQNGMMQIYVGNELAHNVCLFGVANYLATPDGKYFYLFENALILVYATFAVKMLFSLWHLGFHIMSGVRLLLLVIISPTFLPNYENLRAYLQYNHCDHFTTPSIALYEYAALFCLLSAELLDIIQTREFECYLGPTADGWEDEKRMQMEREAEIRRRSMTNDE